MRNLLFCGIFSLALLVCCVGKSQAQYVTYYSPVVAAPARVVVYRPVVPVVAAPAPVAYTVARPVAYARTRWRPILGGTVTRVRYGYSPVTYYGY